MKGDNEQLIEVEDATPDGGLYMNQGLALFSGRRIKLDHVPKQMKAWSEGMLPDYGRSYGLMYVSDKFKAVVEAIEPEAHQFVPFEIVGAGKKHIADMWFMVVGNRLDSVDREHTTLALYRGVMWQLAREVPREYWPPHVGPGTPSKLCFNLSQIGEHHLWFDRHIGTSQVPFVSSELADALKSVGVTGASFFKEDTI